MLPRTAVETTACSRPAGANTFRGGVVSGAAPEHQREAKTDRGTTNYNAAGNGTKPI